MPRAIFALGKDTAGPAINPFIKAITTIALLFAALVVEHHLINLTG